MAVTKVDSFDDFQKEILSSEKVLVKFEADWCTPCKAMASVVEEVARQHPDYRVIAADIDGDGMEQAIKAYSIRSVPTFVKLLQGEATKSTYGTITRDELSSLLSDVD